MVNFLTLITYRFLIMKKLLLSSLVLAILSIYAQDIVRQPSNLLAPKTQEGDMNNPAIYPINAYKGTVITPDFLVKKCKAPAKAEKAFRDWYKKNQDIIDTLVKFDQAGDWRKYWEDGKAILEKNNIKNMSTWNYVFFLPTNPHYVVQIAGPVNKVINVLHANGKGFSEWESKRNDAAYMNALTMYPTYQTISRCANYLKFIEGLELLAKRDAKVYIETKPTYMVAIPGEEFAQVSDQAVVLQKAYSSPQVSDQTYVVLQEAYKENEVAVLDKKPELVKTISQPTLDQLLDLNLHVGLWGMANNLMVTTKGNLMVADLEQKKMTPSKLAYTDLEQQNLAKPQDFYHKNFAIYNHEVCAGIESVYYLLKKSNSEDKYPIVNQWITDNSTFLKTFDAAQLNGLKSIYQRYMNTELVL